MQPSPTLLYQAQVGLELAERSLLLAERSLVLQVAQDYYTLLRLENILGVLDEAIRLGERQLAVAESRFAAGAATRLDVMTAETTLEGHQRGPGPGRSQQIVGRDQVQAEPRPGERSTARGSMTQ